MCPVSSHLLCLVGLSSLLCPFVPCTTLLLLIWPLAHWLGLVRGHPSFLILWWVSCLLLLSHCSSKSLTWCCLLLHPLWGLLHYMPLLWLLFQLWCLWSCLYPSCLIRSSALSAIIVDSYHITQCKIICFPKRVYSCFISSNFITPFMKKFKENLESYHTPSLAFSNCTFKWTAHSNFADFYMSLNYIPVWLATFWR